MHESEQIKKITKLVLQIFDNVDVDVVVIKL